MWGLKAFALGTVAVGVLAYAVLAALAVTAQAGGRAFELAVGPLALVSVTHDEGATVTTFGPGLVGVALVGGLLNLVLARLLRQRSGPPRDRVD
jgi:hypothetical protein